MGLAGGLATNGISGGSVAGGGGLLAANNLSDVASASTSLANLGGAPLASPTFTGTVAAAATNITSTSATAFTVAAAGANYGLQVDESTASAVTGLIIKPAGTGAGLALSVRSSSAAEPLTIDALGTGTITIAGTSTGKIICGQNVQSSTFVSNGVLTMQSNAIANNVNINTGVSNKVMQFNGIASMVNFLSLTASTTGNPVLIAPSGDAAASLSINAATTGALNLNTTNTGVVNLGNSTGLVNIAYAVTALGGGSAPTLGTIGATGPATAAQNSWLKVNINGTASFVPVWR